MTCNFLSFRQFVVEHADLMSWFGQSKVLDDDGNPLIVYHGTFKTFDTFESGHKNGWSNAREGFYFTPDEEAANEFGTVSAYYLKMVNPADLRYYKSKHVVDNIISHMPPDVAASYDTGESVSMMSSHGYFQQPEFVDAAKVAGYDGIIIEDALGRSLYFDSYIAFSADQIKKAEDHI